MGSCDARPHRLAMSKSFPSSLLKRPFQRSIPIFIRQPQPSSRRLHLAPPFLLDRYIPRYRLISSIDAAKKRSEAYAHLRNCNLCPRLCGVNRYEKTGVCLIGAETVKVNTIAPHFGEGEARIRALFLNSQHGLQSNTVESEFDSLTYGYV